MSTQLTPTPNEQFAASFVTALQQWAMNHNNDALQAYNNAVAAAGSHSVGAPSSPVISPPLMWAVDAQLVYNVFTGADPNYDDLKNVFVTIPYVPPPAPAPVIPDVVIQLNLPAAIPGTYEASGDGPAHPVGSATTQDGHTYKKIQVGTSIAGPVFAWQQIS